MKVDGGRRPAARPGLTRRAFARFAATVCAALLAWPALAERPAAGPAPGLAAIASAPRLHHQYRPDAVFAEPGALTPAERAGLEERGHSLRPWPATIGNLQVVTWDRATGRVGAASDPRWGGGAAVRPQQSASAVRPDRASPATP